MMKRLACPSRYAWRKLESKVVILDTTSGDYFLFNETASTVWESLISQQQPREICQKLIEEYEVSEEKALKDVEDLTQRLKVDGFLEDRV